MSADGLATDLDDVPRAPRVRPASRAVRTRRLCLGFTLAAFAVAAALAARYLLVHGAVDPARTGPPLVPILLAGLLGCAGLAALAVRVERGTTGALRRLSIAYSLLVVLGLALVWGLIAREEPARLGFGTPVLSEADAAAVLDESGVTAAREAGEAFLIPTGVYVQSIEFHGANDVVVTGYVWQRYADDLPADLDRGILLPEAREATDWAVEAYRSRGPDDEVIGWYFSATLRQSFDYTRYPFDRQDVWLRFWPQEQIRWVVLVPDFSSYAPWAPARAPGLEDQFVLEGWDLEYTVFSYGLARYDSSFGMVPYAGDWLLPELYFNVGLERHFVGVLEGRLIPILAVAFLLFALVLATEKADQRRTLLGFNVFNAMPFAAALCFIVILDHNQLRDSLHPPGLIYLESAHLILYGALVLAVVNLLLLVSHRYRVRFVEYEDNVLPNLIFWPVLLTLFLVVTLMTFYGP